MTLEFWGVRGSLPVPGSTTLRYGGNTACLVLRVDGAVIIFDAGTGIRPLGLDLPPDARVVVIPTHAHADHVMGFPFFSPLYDHERRVELVDCRAAGRDWSLLELLDGVYNPIRASRLHAEIRRHPPDELDFLREFGVAIRTIPLNHPGGSTGFRIEVGGRTIVHLTDNEIDAPVDIVTTRDEFVRFARGADLLIHDAQYRATELPERAGWGHSTVEQVCDLGAAAGVGSVVLFHHDPARTDAELDELVALAESRLDSAGIRCIGAAEGMTIPLG